MAPLIRSRQSLAKDRLSSYLGALKAQPYIDPGSSRLIGANSLRTIAWNPLGTLIATGSAEKTLRVWNPEKPNVRFSTELKGHSAPIERIAFNPVKDGELCSVSSDGVVKFWDVRTKTCVNEVKNLGVTFSLAWAPDGESLIVGRKADKDTKVGGKDDDTAGKKDHIYVLSPRQSTPLADHQQSVGTNQVAFCWSGTKVFATTTSGRIRILSYPDLKPLMWNDGDGDGEEHDDDAEFSLKGHTSSALSVELSPTGRWLATGGSDSIISLWDTDDWICKRTITSMVGPVTDLSFSFDGSYIVGGSNESSGIEITHVESGEHVHTFKTPGACQVVSWAPTRYCLAYDQLGSLRIIGVDTDRK